VKSAAADGDSFAALKRERDEAVAALDELQQHAFKVEAQLRAYRVAGKVTGDVASAFQKDRILAAVPEALVRHFGVSTARIWEIGPGDLCATCIMAPRCPERTACLHLVESGERGPLDVALKRVPLTDYSVGAVAALGAPRVTNDLVHEPSLADPDWARIERLTSFAGYPLVHEGRLLGVLAVYARDPLREELLEVLRLLARQAATAIAGAEVMEQLRTERVRLTLETRRLRALLDSARFGIIMIDRRGHVLIANDAYSRVTGIPKERVLGQHIEDVRTNFAGRTQGELPPPPGLEPTENVIELLLPERRTLRRTTAPVRAEDGTLLGSIIVMEDITREREVDRMKSEFISTVSHELRTPLTSIKGSLALLLDGTAGEMDEETAELIGVAKSNADRLVRLINDILDISKIEAGRMELHLNACAPADLITVALQGNTGFAQKCQVALAAELEDGLPRVRADADRVVQVLTNLISNACKFSPAGATVTLRALRAEGKVRFEIADRGRGVPPEFRDRMFGKFQQVDSSAAREKEGTGLGLAICKALVREHGGDIDFDSEVGRGTTFHFTIPAVTADLGSGRAFVLVVGASTGAEAQRVRRVIEAQGFAVVASATDADASTVAATGRPPAALVMDLSGQPNMELADAVRQRPSLRDLPTVYLGPPGVPASEREGFAWLPHPFSDADLARAVRSATGLAEARATRLLLVEDDAEQRQLLETLFKREGFEVASAGDAREAIAAMALWTPDVITLDVRLPDLNGFQLTEILRRDPKLAALPTLVVSALDLTDEERLRLALGPTRFLVKSRSDSADILRNVAQLLAEKTT
jgi:PAS domain S-box-containing protein